MHWWHLDYFHGIKELTPDDVARLMNARVLYFARRHCEWVAILEAFGRDTPEQGQAAH
ncbi:MAG TPA: hypothetical protein VGG56_14165 [Terracidiphilus sp.]